MCKEDFIVGIITGVLAYIVIDYAKYIVKEWQPTIQKIKRKIG